MKTAIKENLLSVISAVIIFTFVCSCGSSNADAQSTAEKALYTSGENGFTAELTGEYEDVSEYFHFADGWTNGSMFDCTWRRSNGVFGDGKLTLTIDADSEAEAGAPPYSGSEFRTNGFYGYGYYETEMKPIKNTGVVSSFFTYTGPSDNNPWDEIDIEFLGKDTSKVQFNYFTDGKGNHEHLHDLGFDASEEFHSYGFDWQQDSITWYVDGEAVYTAMEKIPSTPGRLMMNVWPGTGVDGWLGKYDGAVPLKAEYRKISYSKNGKE